MKTMTNPSHRLRAWAESSCLPSTLSCVLMLPITPCNNTEAFKKSSLGDTGNRDFPFSSIQQPVKFHSDEERLPYAADS